MLILLLRDGGNRTAKKIAEKAQSKSEFTRAK
jgi:hypothetical protein